jgi:hypothetical protein
MPQRRNELADKAVLMLATASVMMGGLGASIFLIVSSSSKPANTLLCLAGGCLAVGAILWLLREPDPLSPRASIFAWFRRPKTTTYKYKLKLRQTERPTAQTPQQPPTADHIRQLSQESLGTWVPSQLPPRNRTNGPKEK